MERKPSQLKIFFVRRKLRRLYKQAIKQEQRTKEAQKERAWQKSLVRDLFI